MSAAAHAHSKYGHVSRAIKTPRDIEYELIAGITGRLKAAKPAKPGRVDTELAGTLLDNARMWSAFAVDLAHPENGIPEDLRARLMALAQFTLQHTLRIHAGTGTIEALIDINTAIMRGLRGERVGP